MLTLWQGLGYYRRARNLHAAGKMVVAVFAGRVPDRVEDLLRLPGVGRYTAGAVASVAYDVPAPIVDGNVARVFARYFLIQEAIDRPATLKRLWAKATDLVESAATAGGSPRDFNQAVMELGAMVCTPKRPTCLVCPLRETCGALSAGAVDRLPTKSTQDKAGCRAAQGDRGAAWSEIPLRAAPRRGAVVQHVATADGRAIRQRKRVRPMLKPSRRWSTRLGLKLGTDHRIGDVFASDHAPPNRVHGETSRGGRRPVAERSRPMADAQKHRRPAAGQAADERNSDAARSCQQPAPRLAKLCQ